MLKSTNDAWLTGLNDEDRAFIKRFLLASGSLKELAKAYKISYPTVRVRVDRLIEKIRIYDAENAQSDFERTARGLFADGKIEAAALKTLLDVYQEEQSKKNEN